MPAVGIPMTKMAEVRDIEKMTPQGTKTKELAKWHPMQVPPARLMRLAGLTPHKEEKAEIRFVIRFPRNTGTRDVTLAFCERGKEGPLGQMNYVFKIRNGIK
jgi:hypothetical protein